MSFNNDRSKGGTSAQAALRGQRILDYLDESLAEDNPLLANLGVGNSDLMHFQNLLRQYVDDALGNAAPTGDEVESVLIPAVGQFLKVAKQIERNARFSQKIKLDENSASSGLAAAVAAINDDSAS